MNHSQRYSRTFFGNGLSVIFAIGLSLVGTISAAAAATYHVATNGSDTNPGTSTQPWRTLSKANQALQPGDTVLIHAGTYTDQIRPARSGTSDTARITYQAAGDGNVNLTAVGNGGSSGAEDAGAIALGGRSYVTVDGVSQSLRVTPGSNAFSGLGNFTNASYCIVNSVYFDGSTQPVGGNIVFLFNFLHGGSATNESKYNVLRNSFLTGRIGSNTQFIEDVVEVAGNAHHNLIEGNTIQNARHVALSVGSFVSSIPHDNVIRNNIINNPEHVALGIYNKGPYLNIIEGNIIMSSGGKPASPTSGANGGIAIEYSGGESIFRHNVIAKGGATTNSFSSLGGMILSIGGEGGGSAINNRFYNNTVVKNNGYAFGFWNFGGAPAPALMRDNKMFNNFIYDTTSTTFGNHLNGYRGSPGGANDRYVGNVFGQIGQAATTPIITSDPVFQTVNLATAISSTAFRNPGAAEYTAWNGISNVYDANLNTNTFNNYTGDDYTLRSTSPHIDTGAALTQVASSDTGSGTTLKVDDSRFFQDGRGIPTVQGDWIALGTSTNAVQISSVNYSTNTITLATSVSRQSGNKIWLYKRSDGQRVLYGSAPDIGAFENVSGGTTLAPPTNLRVVN